jgi:hypothetical protein
MTKGTDAMTPLQYAAALLYCQEQVDLCGKDGEAEDARRFAALERDLWGEVTQLGLAGHVEDQIEKIAGAPDLVRDLARSLGHPCSGAFSASVDSRTSSEAPHGNCA